MSLVLREIIRAYRSVPSPRPDDEIHVRDVKGVVHLVTGRDPADDMRIVACGGHLSEYPKFMAVTRYTGPIQAESINTWDPVDCMACLTRRRL